MPVAQAQIQVGDASLPNQVTVSGTNLVLNGAGIRKKAGFLKLYSGGLYLTSKTNDARAIVNADENMNIKLHITSKLVSAKRMISAVDDGFEASLN